MQNGLPLNELIDGVSEQPGPGWRMVRNDNNIPITGRGRGREKGVTCQQPWPLLVGGRLFWNH